MPQALGNAAASTPKSRELGQLVASMQKRGHLGHLDTQVMGAWQPIPATAPQAGRTIAQAPTWTRISPPATWAVQRDSGAASMSIEKGLERFIVSVHRPIAAATRCANASRQRWSLKGGRCAARRGFWRSSHIRLLSP